MAIDLSTAPGGLFPRFGKEIGGFNEATTAIGATANSRANTIAAEFASAQQRTIDNLYSSRDSYEGTAQQWLSYLRALVQQTLIDMCVDDGTGISPATLAMAVKKLIAQMAGTSDSINKPTVAAAVTAGSANVGTGVCIASLLDAIDGLQTDYPFAETLVALCTNDGYLGGGSTSGQEPFSFRGQVAVDDLAWNWPQGSGALQNLNALSAAVAGQIIGSGDFEAWEGSGSNTPSLPWEVITGTPGTTIKRGSSAPYTGSYNLQYVGNGSELTCIRQTLVNSSLAPNTVYGFNYWAKSDGSVAAGVLRCRLVDGANNVINDAAGNANAVSKTLSALTSSYAAVSGFFRTPAVMPSTVKLEIALSTALTNTEVIDIDRMGMVAATRLYAGGPYTSIFSGATPFAKNDTFSLAVTNSLTMTSFARALDRLLQLRSLSLKIPSSGSPSLSDGLIS